METIYLGIVVFLFLLAIFDLYVGVSNDAVNFLNSAIGAKAASFRTILIIAAVGIFCGATMSNGMMEIARHGIFRPEAFYFNELMCIFLAVMVTDVVLLDIFNTLGMPTSTTVSMVFELLGGTFALALVKIVADDGGLGFAELLNTEKALTVILGIFLSVAVAFFFGTVVQYLARLLFTFHYKTHLKWSIGLFGGVAVTAIVYFMLIKGVKDAAFMTAENKAWVQANTGLIVGGCLLFFTLLMQILHWCRVNVFKVIVLLGTFALAMAFAGNDLVNFVGVPLAGFSSYMDWVAHGSGDADGFLMGALNSPAKTPLVFLILSGVIMVVSLMTSRKAQNVVKTSVSLSRQEEGEEIFGSSAIARSLVRTITSLSAALVDLIPVGLRRWMDKRFNKEEMILADGAAFDLVRASVNLVLAGLLIALGTSLKLPLSTTYVAFMVAMGSSLADRAWGRESAVFRVTGVLSVIGGWFITAGAAFIICFLVTLVMYYGGIGFMLIMICVAVLMLVRSNIRYRNKLKNEQKDEVFQQMMQSRDKREIWNLLRRHVREQLADMLSFTARIYIQMTEGFVNEDLKSLRKAVSATNDEKDMIKKIRRKEMLGMRRIDRNMAIEKNTWFHLESNSSEQIMYCLKRMCEPLKEHVDNNFNPLPEHCVKEFLPLRDELTSLVLQVQGIIMAGQYEEADKVMQRGELLREKFSRLQKLQLSRVQEINSSLKISLVYLNLLQESQELVSIVRHLLRASRKFQG